MKRRDFLVTSALLATTTLLNAKEDNLPWIIIEEVFEVLFPKTNNMPSSKEFGALNYLYQNSKEKSFDKSDLEYLLQGALDFNSSFPLFLKASKKQKEEIIQEVSLNSYGESWLSLLIYYGIEAMLSDPIYGGNKNEIGYKALNFQAGNPKPKVKYGKINGL
ncbi:hypothetical protein CP985_00350 [Malaciobacter mytili LMG 24559]|uniref:Gluconate 2-dehydrogenase subunit 3 family protein n=1 Tax=Malaciobacter mytili LMG 24559 TaxID=1032238 RepID=A0AAX2AJ85_9BACT|nr:gluconate 2-dehydrogenase subunit 3 family protein [Malaciobacter mytili]AXH16195.1 hypothetical protein AMYT_2663 [Malaciobacter mytili LMG 24559]RXK17094.1 hypothetical protein CP985_00350 [Malaciobacter mytili LMG 24559]